MTLSNGRWDVVEVQLLEVRHTVIEGHRESRQDEAFVDIGHLTRIRLLEALAIVLDVLQSIRVEQIELALPEDVSKLLVELGLQLEHVLLRLAAGELTHQRVNVVGGVLCVGPLFEMEGEGELLLADLEKLRHGRLVVESDRVRDLLV